MIEIKKAHELDIVELTEDLPEFGLRQGERGTVVEAFDNPEEAYMLEFVNETGASSRLAYGVKPDQIKNIDAIAKEFYAKGMKALSEGKFVESLRNLRKAINLIPSYIGGLHNSLAQSIRPHEDWQRFIFAMHLVRLIDPDYEIARDNLAIAYLNYGVQEAKNRKYEESLHIFHAALAVEASQEIITLIKENIAASHTALGIQAFRDGNMEGALVLFRSAHFIASTEITRQNFGKAHFHYANFFSSNGDLQRAIDSYERAEDAGLMLPEVLNNHACALADSVRLDDAIMILETAQTMAPEDEIIKSNLSKLIEVSKVSSLNVEATALDFVTEDIEIDFLNPPMNTVALRITA
jgi:tetratricopeptide (TPR) repeat protein